MRFRCLPENCHVSSLDVWKIQLTEISDRFEKKTGSMLRVPCWIGEKDLSEPDSLPEVTTRGFTFDNMDGMFVTTGRVSGVSGPGANPAEYMLLYCEVAVGRAYSTDMTHINSINLPEGFDSLYIHSAPIDANEDGVISLTEYDSTANFNHRDAR